MSSSGKNSGNLMSSAGLVRYFDSEDSNAITIDPRTILVFAMFVALIVRVGNILL